MLRRMTTNNAKPTRRMSTVSVEADPRATAHDLAAALHRAGAMDALDMREMDRLCLPPRPYRSGPDVHGSGS
jgi:hypothetical protein